MSDNFVIDVQLDIPLPQPQKILTISRNFKAINKEIFLTALCESILDFNHQGDPESGFKWYNETMQSLLDESAPPTSKERPVRRRMLWYNDDIHLARREKRRAERKWKKTKSDVDRDEFLDKQRYSSNLICRTKIAYFHSTLSSCENKDLYKTVDYLLNRKIPSLPVHDSVETLCNNFLTFFGDKIKKIQGSINDEQHISTFDPDMYNQVHVKSFSCLDPTTEDELLKIILASPSKSCSLDPIPTWFLKEHVHCLLPVLTNIVNSSLQTGTFPSAARSAIIRPLIKKQNLDKDCLSNYRPVSNLSFLEKLIEKVACRRLTDHMNENRLWDPNQSAYRPYHSTESALIKVKNDILSAMDKGRVVLLLSLDLSAAFDTIDRHILICRLSTRICIWTHRIYYIYFACPRHR
ncbi:uncharacterized protein LOC115921128 [Strongylocentrotus purpuratus]|uniref:Reverse transcriptase domain-containing protein n=1 Tax=Strongylocentrotus purpuratus TaxID=7668 RepID=A0A7M7NBX1_STRPU|nr:uncharacterized protein LOC115921128 [Strongylocentrotus purpuratus]